MLRSAGLALILCCATLSPARAAAPACAAIESDAERLACYDKAFPRAALTPAAPRVTGWTASASPSSAPGHTDRRAVLASQNDIRCRWGKPRPVEMRVACTANVTSVSFETGCYMTSSRYRHFGDVTWSADGGATQSVAMDAGPANHSLGLWSGPSAIPFLRGLLGSRSLRVRMTPFEDQPISATFDISGLAAALKPVREECGW